MSIGASGRLVAALVSALCLLGGSVGDAMASAIKPAPHTYTRPETSSLPWPAIGLPSGVVFTAADEVQTYAVRIPPGLRPTALTGVLRAPVNFGSGHLEIDLGDGAFVGAVDLPAGTSKDVAVPFRVSLAGVPVHGGVLSLELVARQDRAGAGRCGPTQQLAVNDLALGLTGTALAPSTVDAFFPPVLRSVTLYVDPHPTPAEEQAVLQLTAALVAHYEPLPVKVAVAAWPRDAALPSEFATALDRKVVIRQDGTSGIAVVPGNAGRASVLTLSGSPAALPVQAALFTTGLSALTQVPDAQVIEPGTPALQTASVYTLGELGIHASATVLGQGSADFELDQGTLGGPLSSIEVHLVAAYTPLAQAARGTVSLSVDGVVLFTTTLGGSGHLDVRFRIPRPLLTRDVSVHLALAYDPGTICSPLTPQLDFSVDPRSTVTIDRLSRAVGGFSALPTAFFHGFDIALQDDDLNQLRYATLSVAGLQAMTSAALQPDLVSLLRAKTVGVGTLVVGDATAVTALGLDPPLHGSGADVAAEVRGTLRARIPDGDGSIQVFADRARNRTVVLVTTTGSWSLVDPLFGYLADPANGGWNALSGDVLVAGRAAHPANLTIRDSGVVAFVPQSSTAWQIWLYLGGAALLVVAGIGIVAVVVRGRRPAASRRDNRDRG